MGGPVYVNTRSRIIPRVDTKCGNCLGKKLMRIKHQGKIETKKKHPKNLLDAKTLKRRDSDFNVTN